MLSDVLAGSFVASPYIIYRTSAERLPLVSKLNSPTDGFKFILLGYESADYVASNDQSLIPDKDFFANPDNKLIECYAFLYGIGCIFNERARFVDPSCFLKTGIDAGIIDLLRRVQDSFFMASNGYGGGSIIDLLFDDDFLNKDDYLFNDIYKSIKLGVNAFSLNKDYRDSIIFAISESPIKEISATVFSALYSLSGNNVPSEVTFLISSILKSKDRLAM